MILIKDLCKNYGDKEAVNKLNLEIKKGEIFGFLGPNGAGKTTTIKMLAGLLKESSGNLEINGLNYEKNATEIKSKIGYIPDRPYVYEKMTGFEFLKFTGQLYNMSKNEIKEKSEYWLERFDLTEDADRLTEGYSHGMKQKLVFSSCFLHSPELIIVDEPMVGLDPKSGKLLKDILREKITEGMTIFLSTHTLSVAQELCTRIGIIARGSLIATGTYEELHALSMEKESGTSENLEEVFLKLTKNPEK